MMAGAPSEPDTERRSPLMDIATYRQRRRYWLQEARNARAAIWMRAFAGASLMAAPDVRLEHCQAMLDSCRRLHFGVAA